MAERQLATLSMVQGDSLRGVAAPHRKARKSNGWPVINGTASRLLCSSFAARSTHGRPRPLRMSLIGNALEGLLSVDPPYRRMLQGALGLVRARDWPGFPARFEFRGKSLLCGVQRAREVRRFRGAGTADLYLGSHVQLSRRVSLSVPHVPSALQASNHGIAWSINSLSRS